MGTKTTISAEAAINGPKTGVVFVNKHFNNLVNLTQIFLFDSVDKDTTVSDELHQTATVKYCSSERHIVNMQFHH